MQHALLFLSGNVQRMAPDVLAHFVGRFNCAWQDIFGCDMATRKKSAMHWDFPCLVATKRLPLSGKTECINITLKWWSRRSMNYWGKESRANPRTSWCVGRAMGVTIGRTCGTTSGIATLPKTLFPRPPSQYLWCALLLPSVITSKWTYLITLSMTMLAGCAKPTLQFCSLVRACTLWSSRSQTRNRELRAQWKQTWGCRRYKKSGRIWNRRH